jgi:hypothetical protein
VIVPPAFTERPPTVYRARRDWRTVMFAGVFALALAVAIAAGAVYVLQ